jgi:S-(hydroxymethyl)glutathione dehydrogenase / alcohol dehydrogenase
MSVITCKAAVCWAAKSAFVIEDVEVAAPLAGEVRVKVFASGVCHTDEYTRSGQDGEAVWPAILGHEGAGVVESVGAGVTRCAVGDHVILCYVPECRECKFCRSGKTNLCQKLRVNQGKGLMPDGTTRFTCKGQRVHHFMGCSAFSEYTVLPEIAVAVVRPDAPPDACGLLGCGITTGYGAAIRTAGVTPGSICAIWGLGAVGASVAQGCRAAGAARVIGIDMNAGKFAFAQKLGCTECLNPADFPGRSIVDVLVEKTDGGADFTFECIGLTSTMRQALEASHKGWGKSVIIGVAASGQEIATKPFMLVTGRSWTGSAFGGFKPSDLSGLVDKMLAGELMVNEFITHRMPLADINHAFELMHKGESIRAVVFHGDNLNLLANKQTSS